MGLASYRQLEVWQRAIELGLAAYSIARSLPPDERFGLSSQIRRAAVSVAANIAEGYGVRGRGAYLQRLGTSRGSLHELETHFHFCVALGYCSSDTIRDATNLCERVGKLLTRLIASLERGDRSHD
jgi:four helix bundle protein